MDLLHQKVSFKHLSEFASLFSCFLMAFFYVLSLYFWSRRNCFSRDDPSVLKRRFISVFMSSLASFSFVYILSQLNKPNSNESPEFMLIEQIGFKFNIHALKSCFAAIVLNMLLFLGPLAQEVIDNYLDYLLANEEDQIIPYEEDYPLESKLNLIKNICLYIKHAIVEFYSSSLSWEWLKIRASNLVLWRNYVVSPLTEEFVFRSCMLPIVYPILGFNGAILITPLFFGLAHLHHIIEGYVVNKQPLALLVAQHLFQFSYTYFFGVWSSYLFLRTGSFFASFVSHMFCNFMGFPNINDLLNEFSRALRNIILFFYLFGLIGFFSLLSLLTQPKMYQNNVFV